MSQKSQETSAVTQSLPNAQNQLSVDTNVDIEGKNARLIIVSFFAIVFAIAVGLFYLVDYLTNSKEAQVQTINAVVSPIYRDVRAREEEQLKQYKLLNEKTGVYQIPIDEAMKMLVTEDFNKKSDVRRTDVATSTIKPVKSKNTPTRK